LLASPRPLRRGFAFRRRTVATRIVSSCALTCLRAGLTLTRRPQVDARPASLRQTDRYRLLGRARSMFAFADVIHLLLDEFTGLRARRLPLALTPTRPLQCLFLRHNLSLAPITTRDGS